MQRSFVKVSYTHMLKSFIKAQANCFCIRYPGPSISPSQCALGKATRVLRCIPPEVGELETHLGLGLCSSPVLPSHQPWPRSEPKHLTGAVEGGRGSQPAPAPLTLHQTFLWLDFLLHWLPTYLS